ncbi:hypothetical protein IE53DRAFT_234828 [Violaceomyces palustris]|uniref:Uncharacterized protein n=1 Tax=Violaceomyces palustris TaxID=1673888 RepID=A0ACD0P4Q1_9BASI|nr:hypothetical protein IE53DRAFT_234828 [Violaceomyces palustris]
MPTLFSRRAPSKPKNLGIGFSSGHFLSAVSSTDRLGSDSPTPSTSDARTLPDAPLTIRDLPQSITTRTLDGRVAPYASAHDLDRSANPPITEFGKLSTPPHQHQGHWTDQSIADSKNFHSTTTLRHSNSFHGRKQQKAANLTNGPPSSRFFSLPSTSTISRATMASNEAPSRPPSYVYGYTTEAWETQLDTKRVTDILEVCSEQIRNRGLDQPMIFSSMALDLSPHNMASLIRSYLGISASNPTSPLPVAPPRPAAEIPKSFINEIKFANPHDLGAMIKWALARMGRVLAVPVPISAPSKKGDVLEEMVYVQQRGFLELDTYMAWREEEKRQRYPSCAFDSFLQHIDARSGQLLSSLLSLLSSTTSYSLKNGMTPAKLARIFCPLIFGLPEDDTFARTYDAFIRASNATEHLLLAFIRAQGSSAALPTRLLQHIAGYPSMLATEMTLPGKQARLVPVTQIERIVRLYSPDLVQTACELDLPVGTRCPEWEACKSDDETLGRDPQLTDRFRKLVNLRGGAAQGRGKYSASSHVQNKAQNGQQDEDGVEVYSSLASKRWGDFMSEGFSTGDTDSKLAFDLNESQRKIRPTKRDTVQWSDFMSHGFAGEEDQSGLDRVLSFDDAIKIGVEKWPGEKAEIEAKLRQRERRLPPFNYDTTPRLIASPTLTGIPQGQTATHPISRMDEEFAEVYADYLLGNGWSNRDELTHRSSSFVVVQYRSRPTGSTVGSQGIASMAHAPTKSLVLRRGATGADVPEDPRQDAAWFVIQEIVPAQYRAELEASGRGKKSGIAAIRKLNLFRSRKERGSHPSQDPSADDDDVFKPGSGGWTKQIKLSDPASVRHDLEGEKGKGGSQRKSVSDDATYLYRRSEESSNSNYRTEGSRNNLMSTIRAKSRKAARSIRRGASTPATAIDGPPPLPPPKSPAPIHRAFSMRDTSFTSADYETRSVHESEALEDLVEEEGSRWKMGRNQKRQSKDDAWIDIMLKANGSRLRGQDAAPTAPLKRNLSQQFSKSGLVQRFDDSDEEPEPLTPTQDQFSMVSQAEDRSDLPAANPLVAGAPICTVATGIGYEHPRSSTPTRSTTKSPMKDSAAPFSDGSDLERIDSDGSYSRAGGQALQTQDAAREVAPEVANRSLGHSSEEVASKESHPAANEAIKTSSVLPSSEHHVGAPGFSATRAGTRVPPPIETLISVSPGPSSSSSSHASSLAPPVPLKPRDVGPVSENQSQLDSRRLAESLRSNLAPVDSLIRKKEDMLPKSPVKTDRVDPFAKHATSGRVASIAGRFGGPAKALSPQSTGNSLLEKGPEGTPGQESQPVPRHEQNGHSSRQDLTPSPAPKVPSKSFTPLPTPPPTQSVEIKDLPPSPRDISSLYGVEDNDSIYPEDAASNYGKEESAQADRFGMGEAKLDDERQRPLPATLGSGQEAHKGSEEEGVISLATFQAAGIPATPPTSTSVDGFSPVMRSEHNERFPSDIDGGDFGSVQHSIKRRSGDNGHIFVDDIGRTEDEDEAMVLPSGFREPYQPGMPLDNVMEESESVLSGGSNL